MSICPKGKTSKSRKNMRRAQSWTITLPSLVACPNCGESVLSHRACKACGSYNKRTVLKVDEKK